MIQFAAAASIATAVKEVAGILAGAVEDGDNYKRLDGLRTFLSTVTGKEIDKGAFVTFLETATQGEPYTGEWVMVGQEQDNTRRLRVEGGWIFDIGRGNPIFIADK